MSHLTYSQSAPIFDADLIMRWARQAGEIAMCHFKKASVQHKKADQSFVTEADKEVELFLTEQLQTTYSHHQVIGEEAAQEEIDLLAENIWVIDPIDGTTAFVQGLPGWGISIGLLHQGKPHFGLFYMPLLNDLTYTRGTQEVYSNDQDLRQAVRSDWAEKGFLAITGSAHHTFQIDIRRTRALGSVGANLVYTARGAATAALLPKARLWDLVAGAAILERAGGQLCYLSGKSIDYLALLDGRQAPEPIIAGRPNIVSELQTAIHLRP